MRVFATWYGEKYAQLARVWRTSLRLNCPLAEVSCDISSPPHQAISVYGHHVAGNTHKLGIWAEMADQAIKDNQCIVLMDADMIVLSDLHVAFEQFSKGADVAYTTRPGKIPYNAGIIFLRPTEGARAFMQTWVDYNALLLKSRIRVRHAVERFGGINQAALDRLLRAAQLQHIAYIATLPCAILNSEQNTWRKFGPETAVLHIKGSLRRHIARGKQGLPGGSWREQIVYVYRQIEKEAGHDDEYVSETRGDSSDAALAADSGLYPDGGSTGVLCSDAAAPAGATAIFG